METLAVTAWQLVSGGVLIEGVGGRMECQPGARGHGQGPCLATLQRGACRQHSITISLFV